MIALSRRTMTYKKGDYYIDIVDTDANSKRGVYEAWIYTDDTDKFFMFGMPKPQQSYFEFYEIVRDNVEDYTYMCKKDDCPVCPVCESRDVIALAQNVAYAETIGERFDV